MKEMHKCKFSFAVFFVCFFYCIISSTKFALSPPSLTPSNKGRWDLCRSPWMEKRTIFGALKWRGQIFKYIYLIFLKFFHKVNQCICLKSCITKCITFDKMTDILFLFALSEYLGSQSITQMWIIWGGDRGRRSLGGPGVFPWSDTSLPLWRITLLASKAILWSRQHWHWRSKSSLSDKWIWVLFF